ncbi:hypothetical protein [Hyalangium gracile]|uniref:hypothetical protein n=1 Tax=Hyalangium gracile TaxID=394092 RepID=UPI001CCBE934|nr:hypothetical protein [Hyalangium gracile]
MRREVLLAALLATGAGAEPPSAWDFGHFMEPVRVPGVSAETCEPCHTEVYEAWSQSRHRRSLDNRVFLDGFAAEPHPRCVYCHAPLEEQARAALRWRAALIRERTLASVPAASLAHEGITCSTCHVRQGVVLTANPRPPEADHPLRSEPRLAEPSFCASCHEFLGHEVVDGKSRLTDEKMQTTWSEWRAWTARGGKGTCQDCHMPGKSHAFRGAYDLAFLRGALSLRLESTGGRLVAVVESQGVGHAFPTGDVFRHLQLWADERSVARFGQTFELQALEDGTFQVRRTGNTALQPFVPARVPLPAGTRRVRVTYHYAEERHARRGTVPRNELVVELAARDVSGGAPRNSAR